MTIRRLAAAYAAAAAVFLALDACWLTATARTLYRPAIGHLMADDVAPAPAVLFYAIYVAGIVVMAVVPGLERGRASAGAWRGALLGFVAYATYDLTNQATLRAWPWSITLADLAWGTVATALAAAAATAVVRAWERRRAGR